MEEKQIIQILLDTIKEYIYIIRGKKVMLDRDLAVLYGVSTKVLNQAVKRNSNRFPNDFMFQLNQEEMRSFSRSQFVTLKRVENIKADIALIGLAVMGQRPAHGKKEQTKLLVNIIC